MHQVATFNDVQILKECRFDVLVDDFSLDFC